MTAVTCQPLLTRVRPPQLAALPEVTAALAARAAAGRAALATGTSGAIHTTGHTTGHTIANTTGAH